MRINNAGDMTYCRWANEFYPGPVSNIRDMEPMMYFRHIMDSVRQDLVHGGAPPGCIECKNMEAHGKVSGRQKQLLKIGVDLKEFEPSLISSHFYTAFENTYRNLPMRRAPQDWHIDLGNYCNSGCVFCRPEESSRLATEFKKIGLIKELPPPNWCDDPELVNKFLASLFASGHTKYLHFIGGETLITPAFKTILTALIKKGWNKIVTIGFTTNLTVWQQDVIDLVSQFEQVNLGLSIETLTNVNDYARWPSRIDEVKSNLDRWIKLGHDQNWLLTLRVTPTPITVHELWTVYQYAIDNSVNVESCNFLHNPPFMRPTVLPKYITDQIADHLENWVNHQNINHDDQLINVRNPRFQKAAALQDALSYVDYLRNSPNETERLPDLIKYLKKLEASRGNRLVNYLPKYVRLFQAAGY